MLRRPLDPPPERERRRSTDLGRLQARGIHPVAGLAVELKDVIHNKVPCFPEEGHLRNRLVGWVCPASSRRYAIPSSSRLARDKTEALKTVCSMPISSWN